MAYRMEELTCGSSIVHAFEKAAYLAKDNQEDIEFDFNDKLHTVKLGTTGEQAYQKWREQQEKELREFEASEKGREVFEKRAEQKLKLQESIDKGEAEFTIIDNEFWKDALTNNQEGYNRAILRFASRWAAKIEKVMATGKTLSSCAKKSSDDADEEGITGFMYVGAVSILSKVWVHGEELRCWHNIDTQIDDEGSKANKNGDVLNPALLVIEP